MSFLIWKESCWKYKLYCLALCDWISVISQIFFSKKTDNVNWPVKSISGTWNTWNQRAQLVCSVWISFLLYISLSFRCWIKKSRSWQLKMSTTSITPMPSTLSCWSTSWESWRREKASKCQFMTSPLTPDAKNGWDPLINFNTVLGRDWKFQFRDWNWNLPPIGAPFLLSFAFLTQTFLQRFYSFGWFTSVF